MAREFLPYDLDQQYLLPPSLKEWVPQDHLIFFVSDGMRQDLVEQYASKHSMPAMERLLRFGAKAADKLEEAFGIRTVNDLLRHYPRKYSDGITVREEGEEIEGEEVKEEAEATAEDEEVFIDAEAPVTEPVLQEEMAEE